MSENGEDPIGTVSYSAKFGDNLLNVRLNVSQFDTIEDAIDAVMGPVEEAVEEYIEARKASKADPVPKKDPKTPTKAPTEPKAEVPPKPQEVRTPRQVPPLTAPGKAQDAPLKIDPFTCPTCKGAGKVRLPGRKTDSNCTTCSATGKTYDWPIPVGIQAEKGAILSKFLEDLILTMPLEDREDLFPRVKWAEMANMSNRDIEEFYIRFKERLVKNGYLG